MESLILIASGPADRSRAWLRATCGDAVAAQISRAFIEDTLQTCAAWRATRTGADFNRKVVVSIAANREGDDMPWGALADAAGARLEVRADDDVHRLCAGEFDRGARAVAVIGDATPTLPASVIRGHCAARAAPIRAWMRACAGRVRAAWQVGALSPSCSELARCGPPEVWTPTRQLRSARAPWAACRRAGLMGRSKKAHSRSATSTGWAIRSS
jgi:hypothetical protein